MAILTCESTEPGVIRIEFPEGFRAEVPPSKWIRGKSEDTYYYERLVAITRRRNGRVVVLIMSSVMPIGPLYREVCKALLGKRIVAEAVPGINLEIEPGPLTDIASRIEKDARLRQ